MNLLKTKSLEIVIVLILALFSIFLGLFPTLHRYLETPKGRIFAGTEFYSDDYSIYVSNIFQGQNGRWTLLDKHTSEPHKGTIIHLEYLLWGKITKLLNFNQIVSFHLARLLFGLLFLFVSYFILMKLFSKNRLLRIIIFTYLTLSSGFPIINSNPDPNTKHHFSWLSEIDPVYKTTVLPHYLLGYLFFLLCSYFFLQLLSQKDHQQKNLLFFCLSGSLLGFVHPVELIIFDCLLLIYLIILLVFKIIQNKSKDVIYPILYIIRPFLYIIIFLFSSSLILLYFKTQFNVSPWTHMQVWENLTDYRPNLDFLIDYLLAIGPIFFLNLIGVIFLLIQKKDKYLSSSVLFLFISWQLSLFFLLFFSYPFLKISQVRLLQNPIFFPISIFAGIGTIYLARLTKSIVFLIIHRIFSFKVFTVLIVLITLIIGFPAGYFSLIAKLKSYQDFSTLIYPEKQQIETLEWLSKNTEKEKVVLSLYEAGTLIPFLSGNTIYAGHLWASLNWPEKSKKASQFFSGKYPDKEAKQFLIDGNIDYIFFGFQEQSIGFDIESYPFLSKVFENEKAKIYKVK